MRSPAEHVNDYFASSVQAFAQELDERNRDRFPVIFNHALATYGVPREQMQQREAAFADALLAGMLQITSEIVAMVMRWAAGMTADVLAQASLGFPDPQYPQRG